MDKLFLKATVGAALFAAASGPALAVDGTILIDQSRALAGNVTPGDAPGFPVTISQPGSYRLAGNLRPPAGTDAIHITTSNVTIDLNGFAVIGVPPGPTDFTFGIFYSAALPVKNITIKNGTIADFTEPIAFPVNVDQTGRITDAAINTVLQDVSMTLGFNGSTGTVLGVGSRVQNVSGTSVGLTLICPATVSYSALLNLVVGGGSAPCSFVGNALQQP